MLDSGFDFGCCLQSQTGQQPPSFSSEQPHFLQQLTKFLSFFGFSYRISNKFQSHNQGYAKTDRRSGSLLSSGSSLQKHVTLSQQGLVFSQFQLTSREPVGFASSRAARQA